MDLYILGCKIMRVHVYMCVYIYLHAVATENWLNISLFNLLCSAQISYDSSMNHSCVVVTDWHTLIHSIKKVSGCKPDKKNLFCNWHHLSTSTNDQWLFGAGGRTNTFCTSHN